MNVEISRVCVFISYSWTSPEHEQWVLDLAIRLREHGVDVKLDKWDLKEGQDVFEFMEQMVNSPQINKVLIVCDKGYKDKADLRLGGVGTETQIITPEIYNDVSQEKFIPIVSERDDLNNTFIPTYIKTRKYIDLSSEEIYEKGYETLLRNLYQRPEFNKPALGQAPSWLFEEEAQHFRTANIIKQLQDSLNRNPVRIKGLSRQFVQTFIESLNQFRISEIDNKDGFDEIIVNSIERMLPLRNEYIKFLEILCESSEDLDSDIIIDFFEKIYSFTEAPEEMNSFYEEQFDNFKFLVQELFVYTVIILLEHSQFNTAAQILNGEFFVYRRSRGDEEHKKYDLFRFYIRSIEEARKNRLKSNRISLVADLFIQRTIEKYDKQKYVEADVILYYLSILSDGDFYRPWFPSTYIYGGHRRIRFLQKLQSKRFFEKVKTIFGVTTLEELKEKVSNFQNEYSRGYNKSFEAIPSIQYHIKSEDIGSLQ